MGEERVLKSTFLMDELHRRRIFWHLHLRFVHLLLHQFLLNLPPTPQLIPRLFLLPILQPIAFHIHSMCNLPTPPLSNHILLIQHLHGREHPQTVLNPIYWLIPNHTPYAERSCPPVDIDLPPPIEEEDCPSPTPVPTVLRDDGGGVDEGAE